MTSIIKPILFLVSTMFAICLSLISGSQADENRDTNVEKGTVAWGTDLDAAKADSKKTGKPIFLLFQEIPG